MSSQKQATGAGTSLVIAVIMIVLGGFLGGWLVGQVGSLGSIIIWGGGALSGAIARRKGVFENPVAGGILAAGCLLAGVNAEIYWLHGNVEQARESWMAAVSCLPQFVVEYTRDALVMGLFAAFGAWSAYCQVTQPIARRPESSTDCTT